MSSKKQTIQIIFPANIKYSSLIRHIASEIFAALNFDKIWCNRLKLVVDELFMNAVRYGSKEDASEIHITFIYSDSEIQFVIEDDGKGDNALPADELKKIIEKNKKNNDVSRTSGRGLSMITECWTDSMDIEKSQFGGIKISFNKKVETMPPEASAATLGSSADDIAKTSSAEIKLSGEIDKNNVDEKTALIYEKVKSMDKDGELILDFSDVTYINSTMIGNMAAWYISLKRKNCRIILKNVSKQIRDVLNTVGLLKFMEEK